jgi:hypothetical protein
MSDQITLHNGKRYVMITLVSEYTLPNIIPLAQKDAPKFDEIYFIQTDRYTESFKNVTAVLQKLFPNVKLHSHPQKVDNYNPETTKEVVCNLITELRKTGGSELEIVCNWTLGTKPMAVGMVEAARDTRWQQVYPLIYVDTQNNQIVDPQNIYEGDQNIKKYDFDLPVEEYLLAHGKRVRKIGKPSQEWISAAYLILDKLSTPDARKRVVHSLDVYRGLFQAVKNNMWEMQEDRKQGYTDFDKYRKLNLRFTSNEITRLSNDLKQYGIVKTVQGTAIELVSLEALRFLGGDWLELYVYGKLRDLYKKRNIPHVDTHVLQNVEFEWGDSNVPNEMDVLFTRNGRLGLVECKSGFHHTKENDPQVVYKLENIATTSGRFYKKFLVMSAMEVNPHLKERLAVNGIELITLKKLPSVAEYMSERLGADN